MNVKNYQIYQWNFLILEYQVRSSDFLCVLRLSLHIAGNGSTYLVQPQFVQQYFLYSISMTFRESGCGMTVQLCGAGVCCRIGEDGQGRRTFHPQNRSLCGRVKIGMAKD